MPQRRVDSHQHVNWHFRDIDGSVADLDQNGIEYCWILSWLNDPDDPVVRPKYLNPANMRADGTIRTITFDDLLDARRRYPDRYVIGYCPNPRWYDAPDLLRAAYHMHGARVCGEWKFRHPFDDPRCLEIFKVAGELKMPVVLHLDVPYLPPVGKDRVFQGNTWYGGTVENLERALQACPETVFIGHAPGFWREISEDADACAEGYPSSPVTGPGRVYRLFDSYPNLYADTSAGSGLMAFKRDPAHAVAFLERYADRILFGRDYYGSEHIEFFDSLALDPEILDKIFSKNAESLAPPPLPDPRPSDSYPEPRSLVPGSRNAFNR